MSYPNLNWDNGGHWNIAAPVQLTSDSDLFTPTADQKYPLGAVYKTRDNRWFRYCKDSGTGITKARMACSAPPAATLNDEAQTGYAKSVGDVRFDCLVTTASGLSDGDLVDGYMYCNSGGAIGDFYIIKNNKWTTSDTVLNIEIADESGLRTAILVTDTLTFIKNRCRDVKVNPTTQDAPVIGVPLETVTASYYFWACFRGVCPLIIDASDTVVIGEPIGKAGTAGTAGAGGLIANDGTDATWGVVISVEPGADVGLVDLCIP